MRRVTGLDIEQVARIWGPKTAGEMRMRIGSLGLVDKSALLNSVRSKIKRQGGEAVGVAFDLVRHGIYVDKGAGRGYGGKKKNGKMGIGARPARPWLWQTIDANMTLLGDMVARKVGDDIEKEILQKIVFKTK